MTNQVLDHLSTSMQNMLQHIKWQKIKIMKNIETQNARIY